MRHTALQGSACQPLSLTKYLYRNDTCCSATVFPTQTQCGTESPCGLRRYDVRFLQDASTSTVAALSSSV
jgi:hypothetical protein